MSPTHTSLRPYSRGDVQAQTGSEAATFDTRAIVATGVPQAVLMENAGRAAATVLDRLYPEYGFAQHKGYPTRAHVDRLQNLGPCPIHRRSFAPVRALLDQAQLALLDESGSSQQ